MINALKALERQVAAPLPDQMLAFGISNKGQQDITKIILYSSATKKKDRGIRKFSD